MKNILEKLHLIMKEVDYIQKDKTNTFHNYNYASELAIKEKLHGLLTQHKVLFTTEVTENTLRIEPGEKGANFHQDIKVIYHFWDVDTGEELTGQFIGSGQDKGDKGTYKAITGAIKYILTSTFLIPTGDDPEEDDKNSSNTQTISKPQTLKFTPPAVQTSTMHVPDFLDEDPFIDEKQKTKFATKVEGATCNDCGKGKYILNPKTNKIFCDQKCWLTK